MVNLNCTSMTLFCDSATLYYTLHYQSNTIQNNVRTCGQIPNTVQPTLWNKHTLVDYLDCTKPAHGSLRSESRGKACHEFILTVYLYSILYLRNKQTFYVSFSKSFMSKLSNQKRWNAPSAWWNWKRQVSTA